MLNSSKAIAAFQREIDEQLPEDNRRKTIKIDTSVTKLGIKMQNVPVFEVPASETVCQVREKIIKIIQNAVKNVSEQMINNATIFVKDSYIPSPFEKIGDLYSIFGDKEKVSIRLTLSEKSYQA